MHCYWEGEIQFGAVDGVKQTQSAWHDGKEIVNVTFDPTIISYTSIVETALKVRCASTVYTRSASQKIIAIKLARDQAEPIAEKEFGRPAIRSDQKYYLRNSPLRLLPLTAVQETSGEQRIRASRKTNSVFDSYPIRNAESDTNKTTEQSRPSQTTGDSKSQNGFQLLF